MGGPIHPYEMQRRMKQWAKDLVVNVEQRAAGLRDNLAKLDRDLASVSDRPPPKVTLLDTEYLRATTAAELGWVSGAVEDLRTGALTWSGEELVEAMKSFLPE